MGRCEYTRYSECYHLINLSCRSVRSSFDHVQLPCTLHERQARHFEGRPHDRSCSKSRQCTTGGCAILPASMVKVKDSLDGSMDKFERGFG